MRTRLDFQPYVDALASRMKLGHWHLEVLDESPEGDTALASVHPWHGRFGAYLRFAENHLTNPPEDQRYAVAHELVHLYTAHADRIVRPDLSTAVERAWVLASEYAVDQIASVIAAHLPLPDEVLGPDPEPQDDE